MLKQLENLTGQHMHDLAIVILVNQAIWLALSGQIEWVRVSPNKVRGEVPLGLPGQNPVLTRVIFFWSYSDEGQGSPCYYLNLDNKDGPCRNSADKSIAILAEQIFGPMKKAA